MERNIFYVEGKTKPLDRNVKDVDPNQLCHGRYGTGEIVSVFGPKQLVRDILHVQAESSQTLSRINSDLVPQQYADEISNAVDNVDYDRVKELEAEYRHDIIAINKALQEQVSDEAGSVIHLARTSADPTESATAIQYQKGLEIICGSLENLRDIVLETSLNWKNIPHMDQTHNYDALPTVAGRPFSFYAEMLQSDLEFLEFVYSHSIRGKWGDATGNHHSATDLGLDGVELQKAYCERLKIGYMDAPAQIVGREFKMDVLYTLARIGTTVDNLAHYIRWGKSHDVNLFYNMGKKGKGSSTMPHKDAVGGNPIAEEQAGASRGIAVGALNAAITTAVFSYARDLTASASNRIIFEDAFKMSDHLIRRISQVVYSLGIDTNRAEERFERTYGVTTAQRVMNALVSCDDPMPRSEAHDLCGELATKAFDEEQPFLGYLLAEPEVKKRLSDQKIMDLTETKNFIGQSKEIIKTVYDEYHGKKTLV